MGLDFHGAHLLLNVKKNYGNFGKTLTLARQEIHMSIEDLQSAIPGSVASKYLEPLLEGFFGSTKVDSMDYSSYESASIIHDLNMPVNRDKSEKFDTVIDLGTLEHVFDVATGLLNVIDITALNGTIIHCLPANNFSGHGFWQFSPELFFSLYSEQNGFMNTRVYLADLSDKKYWYQVEQPKNGLRVNVTSKNFLYVMCVTTKVSNQVNLKVFQSDYTKLWMKDSKEIIASHKEPFVVLKKITAFLPKVKTQTERRIDFKLSKNHPQLKRVRIT